MSITSILLFMMNCLLCNNFIFSRFYGCCPFLGVSSKVETASGMGIAVTFVMGIASLFTWMLYHWVLLPLGLTYLETVSFILVIASLVQFVEMFMKKTLPALYKALGIYLPLITTNCAVLAVTLNNVSDGYQLFQSVLSGIFGGLGFAMAIILMAGVRERLETSDIPEGFKGFPISLITAGILSLAFLGFSGITG